MQIWNSHFIVSSSLTREKPSRMKTKWLARQMYVQVPHFQRAAHSCYPELFNGKHIKCHSRKAARTANQRRHWMWHHIMSCSVSFEMEKCPRLVSDFLFFIFSTMITIPQRKVTKCHSLWKLPPGNTGRLLVENTHWSANYPNSPQVWHWCPTNVSVEQLNC